MTRETREGWLCRVEARAAWPSTSHACGRPWLRITRRLLAIPLLYRFLRQGVENVPLWSRWLSSRSRCARLVASCLARRTVDSRRYRVSADVDESPLAIHAVPAGDAARSTSRPRTQ